MATRAAPPISPQSQESLVRYTSEVLRFLGTQYNFRSRMEEIDKVYQREMDLTTEQRRAKAANKGGDASKMQNVTLPVVMPQVETMLSQLGDIFLASYPLFPIFSDKDGEDAALQMSTILGEQGLEFGWTAELLQAFRDGLKYNIMAVEVDWAEKKVNRIGNNALENIKQGSPEETIFAGNAITRIDPYNLIVDTRVKPYEVHTKGEYAGYTEIISRIELKRRFAELDPLQTMNARAAFESGSGEVAFSSSSNAFFVPQVNSEALITPNSTAATGSINWHAWAGLEESGSINYSDMYEYTVLYARILPGEHKIFGAGANTPQIWKLVIVNRKICIFAKRQTNGHDYLPIVVAQPTEAGLGWQDKSFADNAAPFQALASALYNSGIESQRRKVYDRIVYDPSRIAKADIERASSIARIPVKTEAYGKPVTEAFAIMPYRDDNVNQTFSTAQQVLSMADLANGQNKPQQGQFQKGNKTSQEFNEVMHNSDAKPRIIALVLESRFITPIKTILKYNILQYQPAGEVFNRESKKTVEVDPVQLRKTVMEFKMADGLMPIDTFVHTQLFQSMLQMAPTNPMIPMEWDLMGMITYWMKLQGATWIDNFKRQPTQQLPPPNATTPPQPGTAAPA